MSEQEASECIRFSMGRHTTEADVEQAVVIVADSVKRLRREKV